MINEDKVEDFIETLKLDKEHDIVIYDPYIINTQDLKDLGIKNLVRVRRPGWGLGDIAGKIIKLKFEEFKEFLEKG